MRKNELNLIEKEELQKVNREIGPLFGIHSQITSGSYCIIGRGNKVQWHITVGDTSIYNSLTKLRKIGEKVKEIMGIQEVYSFGVKLA